jgi:hypothetical protein
MLQKNLLLDHDLLRASHHGRPEHVKELSAQEQLRKDVYAEIKQMLAAKEPAKISKQAPTEIAQADRCPKGFMIDLLIPASRADDMLLTLGAAFEERWLPKYGARRARQIFLLQSLGAIVGYWINWIKRHLDVLKFFA